MTSITLETVDFSFYDENKVEELAKNISNICEFGYGFFYLKLQQNYADCVRDIIGAGKSFFGLPESEKLKLTNDDELCFYKIQGKLIKGTGPGYRGKGTDPNFPLDSRESYNISSEFFDPVTQTGSGKNKWPCNDDLLPRNWKEVVNKYIEIMLDISIKMRSVIGM